LVRTYVAYLTDDDRLQIIINVGEVLFEVLGEHVHQLGGLNVIVILVFPGAARVEQDLGNAGGLDGYVEPEIRVFSDFDF
jgi:hypothetical protein